MAPLNPGRAGFLSFAKASGRVEESASSLILVTPDAYSALSAAATRLLLAVENPRREFARVATRFFQSPRPAGISARANVSQSALIGEGVGIAAGAYIADGVVVGRGCMIGPNAVILAGTVIGDECQIGANCTIGERGFGYEREDDGTPVTIPHSGGVRIGNHVEIGANTAIDRGTIMDTVIEDHVKMDNLVHIAHNCRMGEGSFISAGVSFSGGVRIGSRSWIGPNASIIQQVSVGSDCVVGIGSCVLKDVPSETSVFGNPARLAKR